MGKRGPPSDSDVGCQENFPGSEYTAEECEFLIAIDRYKRTRRRPYPSWSEVLQVLRSLGWRKPSAPTDDSPSASREAEAKGCETPDVQPTGDNDAQDRHCE